MRVTWQRTALDDVRQVVPPPQRAALRERLQNLMSPTQGLVCMSERYPGCYFIKFRHWLVMYRAVEADHVDVLAVEYNYGTPGLQR